MANFFDNKARAAAAASKFKADPITVAPVLQPWVEKYRPRTLDEVKSQDHATTVLRRMVNASNLPHMLLYGPPGTGKTSTILALSRELFGPELFSSRVLELNASDERGISVIRERVKNFAQQSLIHAPASAEYRQRYPCPPFKIIILDEADSLTQDAQSALRRTMEVYSRITRFCLCCNYVSRIIDPVASRCSKFRFKALDGGDAAARIREILDAEQVRVDDGVVEETLRVAEGDLRKAIQLLQSAARLVAATATNTQKKRKTKAVLADSDDEANADDDHEMEDATLPTSKPTTAQSITIPLLAEISGSIPLPIITTLLSTLQQGATKNYTAIASQVTEIVANGYSANEVLGSLYTRLIVTDDELVESRKKNKLTLVFSEMDKRLVDGVDEHLCLLDLCCRIAGILVGK